MIGQAKLSPEAQTEVARMLKEVTMKEDSILDDLSIEQKQWVYEKTQKICSCMDYDHLTQLEVLYNDDVEDIIAAAIRLGVGECQRGNLSLTCGKEKGNEQGKG